MNKKVEKILVLLVDFLAVNFALIAFFYFRVETGLFNILTEPAFFLSLAAIYFYWLIIFTFVGMYRTWFASSRFDELSTLFKASFFGIFILFFIILYDDSVDGIASTNRFLILIYWAIFLFFVGVGRVTIRSFQRSLLIKGIGRRNALIIGFNAKANSMHNTINEYRGLGLDVCGYLAVKDENVGKEYGEVKVLDTYKNVKNLLKEKNVTEIILALESHEADVLMNVVADCEMEDVSIKIIPDLYEIISGQARTSQIYGFPLIDIMPQLMPEWEKKIKRILDIYISFFLLIITLPVTLVSAIAIKSEQQGAGFL